MTKYIFAVADDENRIYTIVATGINDAYERAARHIIDIYSLKDSTIKVLENISNRDDFLDAVDGVLWDDEDLTVSDLLSVEDL